MGRYLPIGSSGASGTGESSVTLGTPANIQVGATDLSFTATWNAVPNALGYEVRLNSGEWLFTETNAFTGTGPDGEGHVVDVRAIFFGDNGASDPFELDNPVPLVVQPEFTSARVSAVDSAEGSIHPNDATHVVTVPPGFQGILFVVFQSEFPTSVEWWVDRDGVRAREVFTKDGYAGDENGTYVPGNKLLRGYFIKNPSEGTHDMTLRGVVDASGTISINANELAVVSLLIDKVADVDFPFRGLAADISGTPRSSETETVDSSTTDLVLHIMGHSQAIADEGTLGAGETFRARANDNTGDASILVSTKPGASGTTTVGSTGFDDDFCLQGVALSIMGLGEPEFKAVVVDDAQRANESPIDLDGSWESPIGAAPGTISITSNKIVGSNAGENAAMVVSPSFSNDQYAEITWEGQIFCRALVRVQDDTGVNCYAVTVNSASSVDVRKLVDGGSIDYSNVLLTQDPFRNLVAGDKVGIYAHGTTTTVLDIYINGHLTYSCTDSSSPYTGGQPGLARFGSGAIASRFFASGAPFVFDT